MSIKIEINAASAAEMHKELLTLLGGAQGLSPQREEVKAVETAQTAKTETPVKKIAKRAEEPVKAQPKQEPVKEKEPEEKQPEPEEQAPEAEAPKEETAAKPAKVTLTDLRLLVKAKGTKGKAGIVGILKEYGVPSLSSLEESQYDEVYAKIEQVEA